MDLDCEDESELLRSRYIPPPTTKKIDMEIYPVPRGHRFCSISEGFASSLISRIVVKGSC